VSTTTRCQPGWHPNQLRTAAATQPVLSKTTRPRSLGQAEMGNLVICNHKLIETITLPITIGNWHYSRRRVTGDVVDSITEPPKKQLRLLFIMTYKKYKFIHNTKYCFKKLFILIELLLVRI